MNQGISERGVISHILDVNPDGKPREVQLLVQAAHSQLCPNA
jgi:hypothetical protein